MNADWQTVVALAIVAIAVAALLRAAFSRRKGGSSCGGCGPDKFKRTLRRK